MSGIKQALADYDTAIEEYSERAHQIEQTGRFADWVEVDEARYDAASDFADAAADYLRVHLADADALNRALDEQEGYGVPVGLVLILILLAVVAGGVLGFGITYAALIS